MTFNNVKYSSLFSTFPNNYMDTNELDMVKKLTEQCDAFEEFVNDKSINELDVKRFIQNNKYYHIPASIISNYRFGHHETVLFKEFQLGTSFRADYVLLGRSSGGWQFVFVEFEKPYGRVTLDNKAFGKVIRDGLEQINDWKSFIESSYSSLSQEFLKHTRKNLPNEFYQYDSSRMHFVVVAGRRADFSDKTYRLSRKLLQDQNVTLLHYDNIIDMARNKIGANTY